MSEVAHHHIQPQNIQVIITIDLTIQLITRIPSLTTHTTLLHMPRLMAIIQATTVPIKCTALVHTHTTPHLQLIMLQLIITLAIMVTFIPAIMGVITILTMAMGILLPHILLDIIQKL